MTTHDDALAKTCRAVAKATAKAPETVLATQRLASDLDFDSLKIATLSLEIEDEFGEFVLLNEWMSTVDPETVTDTQFPQGLDGARAVHPETKVVAHHHFPRL